MRFVQGIDYGPRRGTLGWNVHMAEGGDGTVGWLAKRKTETVSQWRERVNGVSANFVILTTGEAVQMVGWDRAAGNLNPNDRSSDKAFYGRRFLLEVLGTHWTDPNAYTLSVEICGFRAEGPNRAQVETLIGLIAESRQRFPGMVGAFGHADQTDTKGCPGTAPLMREFWERVGHGKFATGSAGEADVSAIKVTPTGTIHAYIIRTAADAPDVPTYGPDEGQRGTLGGGFVGNGLGVYGIDGLGGRRAFLLPNRSYVAEADVSATKWERPTVPDTTAPVPVPVEYPVAVTVNGKPVVDGKVLLP